MLTCCKVTVCLFDFCRVQYWNDRTTAITYSTMVYSPCVEQSCQQSLYYEFWRKSQVNSQNQYSRSCWHGMWADDFCGYWPGSVGMKPVACGPHRPPPGPIPRCTATHSSDSRHRFPEAILCFAEYALLFPIYMCLSSSLLAV